MLSAVKKILRAPAMIVGEIAAVAIAAALGATVPQAGAASAAGLTSWREGGPVVSALVDAFALDHVFRSWWFLGLVLLASASLLVVVIEQAKRLRVQWFRRLAVSHFEQAPLRAEFERPARGNGAAGASVRLWTEKRFGLAGSAVFHFGLLLALVAAAFRALFGTNAMVDLIEGETLPPTAAAWGAQWPGVLGRPLKLDVPVRVEAVNSARYRAGDVRELKLTLAVSSGAGFERKTVAVNHDLDVGGIRLFLGSEFGPAALLEWQSADASSFRQAILLQPSGRESYEAAASGPAGLRAHLRAQSEIAGEHPASMEVRIMKDNALLLAGEARVGETVSVPGGAKLTLHGAPQWVRLRGSHDSALPLGYVGFGLMMLGAIFLFVVVRVDGCIVVTPLGKREKVFIALKPQRFAPLFRERFEQLVREMGGSTGTGVSPVSPQQAGSASPCALPVAFNGQGDGHGVVRPASLDAMGVAARVAGWLLLAGMLALTSGCERAARDQARQLVERYNKFVCEAYRRGDVKLADPVVGPNEGKKLTGLIGVRLDMGLTLDSQLLSLEIKNVEKRKDQMKVRTNEQWRYRDLKIGTGEQVGEESLDQYDMLYIFKRIDQQWLVDEIQFASKPQVGRKTTTWAAQPRTLHGIVRSTNEGEGNQP
jgi:hypothetical protein